MGYSAGRFKVVGSILLAVMILGLGVGGGFVLDRRVSASFFPSGNTSPKGEPDYKLMAEAWGIISKEYVGRRTIEPQKITYGAISGMVDSLGDIGHSTFVSPESLRVAHYFAEGNFGGIGAQIRMKDGRVVVVAPMDGSPARQAGLQSGDIILKVNGEDITGLPLDQTVSRITGEPATPVSLTVLNPKTGQTREISLMRAIITIHNVTWQRLPDTRIADVHVAGFSRGVTDDLRKVLSQIKSQGLKGIVLDLRDNPGGVLNAAIGTASQFLSGGNVVLEKNSRGEVKATPVQRGGAAPDIPMVVIINEGTASGAEIVAGALQDARRAPLVGQKTFGAGTVLKEFDLSDGSALLLAVEEWLTPDGHVIWHKGIAPDQEVPLPAEVTPLFPETGKVITADELRSSRDTQLQQALDLLLHPLSRQASARPHTDLRSE